MEIGRYQILEKLGQGGMGVVHRAFDTLLQRVVAVKLISAPIEEKSELRERFLREARAAGQLAHKNIITIHDLGEHEGRPYLAMEYLEGEDLQRCLSRSEPMSLARKLDLAIELSEALEFAHGHGVVHRDIKPANVFITSSGTVKVLDFGLARLVTSELTNSNMMMGTLNYMAPEQVRGERADHRSDIFSVGVVVYELLSGRKAFQGDSFASTLFKILETEPVPLADIDASLPREVVAIVERALAKPREGRYQHIADLKHDLAAVRQQLGFQDSPARGYSVATTPFDSPDRALAQGRPHRAPSDAPRTPPSGGSRRSSDAHERSHARGAPEPMLDVSASEAPTGVSMPTPIGIPAPSGRRGIGAAALAGIALVAAVAIAGYWITRQSNSTPPVAQPAAPPQPSATATAGSESSVVASTLLQAVRAFEAEDYTGAERHANSVLALAPSHAEAQSLRDRARRSAEAADRGLRAAKTFYDAGRYEEASRAAGEVLSVAPGNRDARRIMTEGAARSRGRGADEARNRMAQARAAARGAGAPAKAADAYTSAAATERDADRLYRAGQLADATAKYYEASGLYRSAEVAAQSKTATAPAPAAPPPPPPAATTTPTPEPAPPTPVVTPVPERQPVTPPVTTPAPPPVATPAPPPPAPAPATPEPAAPPAPRAEDAINDLLSRYKAALEARSLEALKRLWPSLGGGQQTAIQNEFQHATRIQVDLIRPQVAVSGTSATVTFIRRYHLQTTDGQRLQTDTPTTMRLRQTGGGWVIDDIRFEPTR